MIAPHDTAALRALMHGRTASFAVGVPGVVAEFHWTGDEPVAFDDGALALATARGGLRLAPGGAERVHACPSAPGADPHHGAPPGTWCYWLEEPAARLAPGRGLAELGPDARAIRVEDREAVLFDLGFGLGHLRACVRSANEKLIGALRAHAGADLLTADHPAMAAVKRAQPHRVFITRMARIEVYQPIPSRARGERTPDGPHTHVLPALLGRADPLAAGLPATARNVLTVYSE